ncbi:hypothetical protein [Anaerocolumna jejuensis]|uniref:hypothetical protein n=1 Tax=Anaerocolumna jejuensis TaxID=259063 RepID=UPI003F7B81AA
MTKILLFNDRKFPDYIKLKNVPGECRICTAEELKDELQKDYDIFVSLHGDSFPADAAEALFLFLQKGKGFLNAGGIPLLNPYYDNGGLKEAKPGLPQLSYFRRLNIHAFLEVDCTKVTGIRPAAAQEVLGDLADSINITIARNLVWNPTKDKYEPDIWGTVGPMDVTVTSLLNGYDTDNHFTVSYATLVENWKGKYAGGRWILIPGKLKDRELDAAALLKAFDYLAKGCRELTFSTGYASYRGLEHPSVKINLEQYGDIAEWNGTLRCLYKDITVEEICVSLKGKNRSQSSYIDLPNLKEKGRYDLELVMLSSDGETMKKTQGFYIYDEELLSTGGRAECQKDYFLMDGKLQPVIGTTYMSDEVSRDFLLYPNPTHWYQDMKCMKEYGINWIRTGIWCNWRRYMWDDGRMDEAVLRALDAFLQAAGENYIHVTFTFFSFVPEDWEGTNPYLDERSLIAQEHFIAAFVSRYAGTGIVDWDLINEPYTFDHPTTRKKPADTLEQIAFADFLKAKYKEVSKMIQCLDLDGSLIKQFSDVKVPSEGDINFTFTDIGDSKNGSIWRDYRLFTVEVFKNWSSRMNRLIKEYDPSYLVCVGQDEGIYAQRPTPLLYGELLDYSAQHPWWHNDALVYSMKSSKYIDKPLLIQETGVMFAERADGWPRRTEYQIAQLLQKKFVYSMATGGAGAIQWIWNTNYMLNSANESHIGAIRNDGSFKPEAEIYKDFHHFFNGIEDYISDIRQYPDISVIYPFSNDFSNRSFAGKACRNLAHILTDILKRDFYFVSEFDLKPLLIKKPRLIILPSPHQFEDSRFTCLMEIAEEINAKVLITGPASFNEYFKESGRLDTLFAGTSIRPLQKCEILRTENTAFHFSFAVEYMELAYAQEYEGAMMKMAGTGKDNLLCIGIPVELSDDINMTALLYQHILAMLSIKNPIAIHGVNTEGIYFSKIRWKEAFLCCIVNEAYPEAEVRLSDYEVKKEYHLKLPGNESGMFLTGMDGNIIKTYKNQTITITNLSREVE